MRKGLLGSVGVLFATAGVLLAEPPALTILPPSVPTPAYEQLPAPTEPPPLITSDPEPPAEKPAEKPAEALAPLAPPAPESSGKPRLWADAEFLMWWFKDSPVPVPLVIGASPPFVLTAFGAPGQSVLLGNQDVDTQAHYGFRLTGGYWLDCDQTCGVELGYFFLSDRSNGLGVSSPGVPVSPMIGVPFFDVTLPGEAVAILAAPGEAAGSATLAVANRLQAAEVNGTVNTYTDPNLRADLLGGFRFVEFDERLQFNTSSVGLPTAVVAIPGAFLNTRDQFDTHNRFYGPQIGVREEYRLGRLFVNGSQKLAVGDLHQSADIKGVTITGGAGVPTVTIPGGFFALGTNSGHHVRDEFAAVSELEFNVGCQVLANVRVFAGYNFFYMTDVARPGQLIDRNINPTQQPFRGGSSSTLVGPAQPGFSFADSEFWAHGLNAGVGISY